MERKKIIVVDDESIVGELTEEILNREGYSVLYCSSAADALLKIEHGFVPDLVITDLRMPIMNGLLLTEAIKGKMPNLPVIILTGNPELVPNDNPADAVMSKPCTATNITNKIRELI